MSTIGFVGLGSMGAPIAGRLLEGHQVYGTNRTQSKATGLIERGLIWLDTPREVAATAPVVFSMVTDDPALAAITSGPDGILAGLTPGAVYVDMSTVSPEASRELAGRVRSLGASMIDAPVSGSVPSAEDGTFAIMAGGPDAAFLAVAPMLHRDIRLALAAARESGVVLPSASVADSMLSIAAELGYGHRDIAAFFQVLGQMAAAPAPAPGPGGHAMQDAA